MVAYQTALTGHESKLLTIGRVMVIHTEEEEVVVQPYRGCWEKLIVVHRPQYQTRDGLTDEVGPEVAKSRIKYDAIKFQVQLHQGGNLNYDSATRLRKGRWGLRLSELETIRFLSIMSTQTGGLSQNVLPYAHDTVAFQVPNRNSKAPAMLPKTFAASLREYDDQITMLDEQSILSRSWLDTGEDLIAQIQRSGQPEPSPEFEGGEEGLREEEFLCGVCDRGDLDPGKNEMALSPVKKI